MLKPHVWQKVACASALSAWEQLLHDLSWRSHSSFYSNSPCSLSLQRRRCCLVSLWEPHGLDLAWLTREVSINCGGKRTGISYKTVFPPLVTYAALLLVFLFLWACFLSSFLFPCSSVGGQRMMGRDLRLGSLWCNQLLSLPLLEFPLHTLLNASASGARLVTAV